MWRMPSTWWLLTAMSTSKEKDGMIASAGSRESEDSERGHDGVMWLSCELVQDARSGSPW